MFESSKIHLAWIVQAEDSQGLRARQCPRTRTRAEHRNCVLATIIEERVNKMLRQIDNDEREGFLPSGSLEQARRELGYSIEGGAL